MSQFKLEDVAGKIQFPPPQKNFREHAQEFLPRALELRAKELKQREIADILTKEGWVNAGGKPVSQCDLSGFFIRHGFREQKRLKKRSDLKRVVGPAGKRLTKKERIELRKQKNREDAKKRYWAKKNGQAVDFFVQGNKALTSVNSFGPIESKNKDLWIKLAIESNYAIEKKLELIKEALKL